MLLSGYRIHGLKMRCISLILPRTAMLIYRFTNWIVLAGIYNQSGVYIDNTFITLRSPFFYSIYLVLLSLYIFARFIQLDYYFCQRFLCESGCPRHMTEKLFLLRKKKHKKQQILVVQMILYRALPGICSWV